MLVFLAKPSDIGKEDWVIPGCPGEFEAFDLCYGSAVRNNCNFIWLINHLVKKSQRSGYVNLQFPLCFERPVHPSIHHARRCGDDVNAEVRCQKRSEPRERTVACQTRCPTTAISDTVRNAPTFSSNSSSSSTPSCFGWVTSLLSVVLKERGLDMFGPQCCGFSWADAIMAKLVSVL